MSSSTAAAPFLKSSGRPLFIIQNDSRVPAGLIPEQLARHRLPFRLLRPADGEPLPAVEEAAGVIVLGGVMGAAEEERYPYLREVKRLMGECVAGELPLFGICLGGQLLSQVLGLPVLSGTRGEKGLCRVSLTPEGARDPLFRGIAREFSTFQWHDDSFDLPEGCRLLASSPRCPQQAIRFGAAAYGVQFHPEVTGEIVASWSGEGDGEPGFAADFRRAEEECRAGARILLDNFFRIAALIP